MSTATWRRFFALSLPLVLLLTMLASPADAGGSAHPYFNDRGTLRWYHSYEEARRVAQREQKLIFIEYGRRACSNCRKLAANVLPHSRIRGRISKLAIGLAAECDRPERDVAALFHRNVHNARTLPFAAFVTPRGRWITGWAGYATVAVVESHLAVAEARHRMIFREEAPAACKAEPAAAEPRSVTPAQAASSPAGPAQAGSAQAGSAQAAPAAQAEPTSQPVAEAGATDLGYTDADLEDDEGGEACTGGRCSGGNCAPSASGCGECEGGSCAAPGFGGRVLAGVKNLFGGRDCCAPKTADAEPDPEAEPETASRPQDCLDFPLPQPRIQGPEKHLAEAMPAEAMPAEAMPAEAMPAEAMPAEAMPAEGAPSAMPTTPSAMPTTPSAMPFGDPDGEPTGEEPPPVDAAVVTAATKAADAGDWAEVLRLTNDASLDQTKLRRLNRRAHAWAHGKLAFAVRAVRERRYEEAREAMDEVGRTMKGEPEAVDAERGVTAVELMRDMVVLAEDSPLRSTVRKTSYEKMRGTRWAPLFSEVAQPSPALSKR